jgi:hypothetical protein
MASSLSRPVQDEGLIGELHARAPSIDWVNFFGLEPTECSVTRVIKRMPGTETLWAECRQQLNDYYNRLARLPNRRTDFDVAAFLNIKNPKQAAKNYRNCYPTVNLYFIYDIGPSGISPVLSEADDDFLHRSSHLITTFAPG